MTIECTTCHARYTIADGLVPPQGARVRCKKCSTVILVQPSGAAPAVPAPTESALVPPTPEPAPAPAPEPVAPPVRTPEPAFAPAPAPAPAPEATSVPAASMTFTSAIFEQPVVSAPPSAPAPAPAPVAPPPVAPAPPPAATSTIPKGTPIPEGLSPEDRQKHERARRLARVLASDVAIYNREKRERSIQEGNLVAALGYEIKKSWETYKERVGTDFANATPYFRDALNEIVAEGKKIF